MSKTLPHGACSGVTFAPVRPATSIMRWPKNPAAQTTILSPGSSRLTMQVSMPAMPVPLIGKVKRLLVWNAFLNSSCVSFMMTRNCGSR